MLDTAAETAGHQGAEEKIIPAKSLLSKSVAALRSLGSVATYRRHRALQSGRAVDISSSNDEDDDEDEVPNT